MKFFKGLIYVTVQITSRRPASSLTSTRRLQLVSGKTTDLDQSAVRHSVGGYVRDQIHTNGMDYFWSARSDGRVGEDMEGKRLRYADLSAGEQVCAPPPDAFIRYA